MFAADPRAAILLAAGVEERCFGRETALASLECLLIDDRPMVVALHGLGGVGKSCLARAFAAQARDAGARVLALDTQSIEPSPKGFFGGLADAMDQPVGHDAGPAAQPAHGRACRRHAV